MPTFRFKNPETDVDVMDRLRRELWVLSGILKEHPQRVEETFKLRRTIRRVLTAGFSPFRTTRELDTLLRDVQTDVDVLMEHTTGRRGPARRSAPLDPPRAKETITETVERLDVNIQRYATQMDIMCVELAQFAPTHALVLGERGDRAVAMYREGGDVYVFFDVDIGSMSRMGFRAYSAYVSLGPHTSMDELVRVYAAWSREGEQPAAQSEPTSTLEEVAQASGAYIRDLPVHRTHRSKPSTGRPLTVFPAGARLYGTDENGDTVPTAHVAVNMPYRDSRTPVRLHWVCPYPWPDVSI